MRVFVSVLILIGVLGIWHIADAQMTSSNYQIRWDTVSTGGSDASSSSTYQVRDTIGNAGIGSSNSSSYALRSGYRQGVFDQMITFDVFAQDASSGREASARVGRTITANTSGLAVGDFIALIQDKGVSQVSAIGQIISLGAGTITVDELKDSGTSPVIDGADDYVYLLDGSAVDLGDLDPAVLSTQIIGFDVSVDSTSGYVVQAFADGNLRSGSEEVHDVADGTVTPGSEEYGARSSDTSITDSTFDTQDTAFSENPEIVADRSATSFSSRDFVTLKASIDSSTVNGTYTQNLSFIVSGNY